MLRRGKCRGLTLLTEIGVLKGSGFNRLRENQKEGAAGPRIFLSTGKSGVPQWRDLLFLTSGFHVTLTSRFLQWGRLQRYFIAARILLVKSAAFASSPCLL
jgi:hypothetical protein